MIKYSLVKNGDQVIADVYARNTYLHNADTGKEIDAKQMLQIGKDIKEDGTYLELVSRGTKDFVPAVHRVSAWGHKDFMHHKPQGIRDQIVKLIENNITRLEDLPKGFWKQ